MIILNESSITELISKRVLNDVKYELFFKNNHSISNKEILEIPIKIEKEEFERIRALNNINDWSKIETSYIFEINLLKFINSQNYYSKNDYPTYFYIAKLKIKSKLSKKYHS